MSLGTLDISRPPLRHAPESDTHRRTPDQGTVANGDEAGVATGVVSNMITGPDRHVLGSAKTMAGAAPSSRLTPQSGQAGHQSWRPFAQFRPQLLD